MTRVRAAARAVALGATCAVAVAAPAAAAAPASERLVVLDRTHHAFARPDGRARSVATVRPQRPITGVRTVLPLLGETVGADGRQWLHVLLPGRPNGAAGWISPRSTRYALTVWRLTVDLSARRVTVWRSGRVARTFRAVVGKPSTPTPRGRFFVEESVRLAAGLVGAPFALALSARSNVLDQFAGGPGQIALHGRGSVGGVLGTAVSHGCVRLDDRAISWLAARIVHGTRVTITS